MVAPAVVAAAPTVVVVVRKVGLLRILAVILLCLWLLWRYFVAPILDTADRLTPWDGVIPGSCSAPAPVRPAGWTGMVNDAGLALHSLAEGPPTPTQMVGWFGAAGREAKTLQLAFNAGVEGRPLLPGSNAGSNVDILARALLAAGATEQEAVTLAAVAGPESRYVFDAKNPTSSAAGPWQEIAAHGTLAERTNPDSAARIAVRLARTQGIDSAWSETYGRGLHVPYIAEAAHAVSRAAPCGPQGGGTIQALAYPQGYEQMTAALQAAFPGVRITSDLRPGAVTSSGRRSLHADGMALDIEPSMEVFDWIARSYPESSELIFSPAGARQINNGRPHVYQGQVVADHVDHIHWGIRLDGRET